GREVEELLRAFAGNARHEDLDNRPHPDGAATRRWTMMVLVALALALAAPAAALDLEGARLLDLTHPFDARTIYWPTAKAFTLEPVAHGMTEGGYWYAANNFSAASTAGRTSTPPSTSPRAAGRPPRSPSTGWSGRRVGWTSPRRLLTTPTRC